MRAVVAVTSVGGWSRRLASRSGRIRITTLARVARLRSAASRIDLRILLWCWRLTGVACLLLISGLLALPLHQPLQQIIERCFLVAGGGVFSRLTSLRSLLI